MAPNQSCPPTAGGIRHSGRKAPRHRRKAGGADTPSSPRLRSPVTVRRGDVLQSAGARVFVVYALHDNGTRFSIKSVAHGLILGRRYTQGDIERGTLNPTGKTDFLALEAEEWNRG